jgi:hypothetical protein
MHRAQAQPNDQANNTGQPANPLRQQGSMLARDQLPGPLMQQGGEGSSGAVKTLCTALCGSISSSRSCGKIIPVNVFSTDPKSKKRVQVYAVIDDQSNRSLASPALLDSLGITTEEFTYTLTSCFGSRSMSGRKAPGLCIQSLNATVTLDLPPLIECDQIPDERLEILTPEVADCHAHLSKISHLIPQARPDLPVGILIGRDLPEAHHVLDQIIGPPMTPFAQRLPLGWVIIGDVCLNENKVHNQSQEDTHT